MSQRCAEEKKRKKSRWRKTQEREEVSNDGVLGRVGRTGGERPTRGLAAGLTDGGVGHWGQMVGV